MPSKGREHFETYTKQNRVKHAILTKYLGAYLQILGPRVDAIHYIDGFAGTGSYEGKHAGSPMYAIELLSAFPNRGIASFVENDAKSFERLKTAVASAAGVELLADTPWLVHGEFSECLDALLARSVLRKFRHLATFAFVDPCGLKGMHLDDLAKILRLPYAECLVFLNYDGLARWAGAVRSGSHALERFKRFFGGNAAADAALECLESQSPLREGRLLGIYIGAIRQSSGAKFSPAFRFQAKDRKRTSHYLIHLSQHGLAFKIMKEIMRTESSGGDDYGTFGLIPRDDLGGQGELFRPNEESARAEILSELRHGQRPASLFRDEWPLRPTDMLTEREYREILLALEAERVVDVVDRESGHVIPASGRRRHRGSPTLGKKYDIRLREKTSTQST